MEDRELVENWIKYQHAQVAVLRSIDDHLRSIIRLLTKIDSANERANMRDKKASETPADNAKRPPRNRRSKGAATPVPLEGQITVDEAIEEAGYQKSIEEVATDLV